MKDRITELECRHNDVLAEMEDIASVAVSEERDFNDTEQESYNSLEKRANELLSLIEKLRKLAKERARHEQPESRHMPRIAVIREDKHDETGECRAYRKANEGGFGDFLFDLKQERMGFGQSENIKVLRAATGANEGSLSDGAALVQSDHAEMLFQTTIKAGVLASRCNVKKVGPGASGVTVNLIDETSRASGSRMGGVTSAWRAEAGSSTGSKPKYRREKIDLEVLESLYYATDELLEDAVGLESFVTEAFTQEIAWKLDDAIVNGDGAGKPLGILNSAALISVAKEGGQAADTVKYENIDKMVDRMAVQSESKAVWYVHADVRRELRNAIKLGTNSDFLLYMPAGGISGQAYDTMFGRAVERLEQCQKLGDLGDIIYADLSQYLLIQKAGVKASQSSHVAFLTSEKVFKWGVRVNGQPIPNSAVQDAYGTTTRSPFVSLAERA